MIAQHFVDAISLGSLYALAVLGIATAGAASAYATWFGPIGP